MKTLWLNTGHYPVEVGFCPDRSGWKAEMKAMGLDEPYPCEDGARCEYFEYDGQFKCLILVADNIDKQSALGIIGLLVHEVTHVWQWIKKVIGEKEPGAEQEAYAMQSMSMELIAMYQRTRLKKPLVIK